MDSEGPFVLIWKIKTAWCITVNRAGLNEILIEILVKLIIYELNLTHSKLSDDISKNLMSRGMKFVGTTIIYSYLQAIGVIYSHDRECFKYREK